MLPRGPRVRWLVIAAVGGVGAVAAGYVIDQGSGAGGLPSWARIGIELAVIGNWLAAGLLAWRGWTSLTTALLTVAGTTTIAAGWLIRAVSAGDPAGSGSVALALIAGGVVVAMVGLAMLEPPALQGGAVAARWWLVGIAALLIAIELGIGAVSSVLGMLAVLWASGMGLALVPLVIVAAMRLFETAGVHLHLTRGIAVDEPGDSWPFLEGEPSLRGVRFGRIAFIGVGALGVVLVLLAPDATVHVPPAGSCPARWGELSYIVEWETLQIGWDDGCRDRSALVRRGHVYGGALLVLAGLVGD